MGLYPKLFSHPKAGTQSSFGSTLKRWYIGKKSQSENLKSQIDHEYLALGKANSFYFLVSGAGQHEPCGMTLLGRERNPTKTRFVLPGTWDEMSASCR